MKILNIYRSRSTVVYTFMFIKRYLITFRKFRQLYTEFWFPSPARPPYSHICQIGDPVLRYKAEELSAEDIKKNEIQGVWKRLGALIVNFGYRDSNVQIKRNRPQSVHSLILCQKYTSKILFNMCPVPLILEGYVTIEGLIHVSEVSRRCWQDVRCTQDTLCTAGVRCDRMIWNYAIHT
jgi:hypothetical protein